MMDACTSVGWERHKHRLFSTCQARNHRRWALDDGAHHLNAPCRTSTEANQNARLELVLAQKACQVASRAAMGPWSGGVAVTAVPIAAPAGAGPHLRAMAAYPATASRPPVGLTIHHAHELRQAGSNQYGGDRSSGGGGVAGGSGGGGGCGGSACLSIAS